jgi:hypothetical protein
MAIRMVQEATTRTSVLARKDFIRPNSDVRFNQIARYLTHYDVITCRSQSLTRFDSQMNCATGAKMRLQFRMYKQGI